MTAIFGGSFDPPHMGHQMAVLYLLESLGFDDVWIVPTYVHPLGKQHVSFEHRVAMCKRMVSFFGARAQVLDVEAALAKDGSEGRTLHLVDALQQQYPDRKLTLVLGSDVREQLPMWHRWEDIEAKVNVIFLARTGYPDAHAEPLALPDVSSTWVRSRLRAQQPVHGLLPSNVLAYIEQHRVYGS